MGICSQSTFLKLFYLIKIVINIVRISAVIILIISLMIEFTHATTSSDTDALSKAFKNSFKKVIAIIILFFIPTFVHIICKITNRVDVYNCVWDIKRQAIVDAENREKELKEKNVSEYNKELEEKKESENNNKKLNEIGEFSKTFKGTNGKTIHYWVLVPEDATENMPLVMYMHGRGGNSSFNNLKDDEMASQVKKRYGNKYPFIVLLPYKTTESWYEMGNGFKVFAELIDEVSDEYKTNKNKTILTGFSDGGLGVWQMGVDYPDKFSAFVPVSGWGHTYAQQKLSNLKGKHIRGIVSSDSYDAGFKYNMEQACSTLNNLSGSNKCTLEVREGLSHGTCVSGATVGGKYIEGAYTKEVFEWMISK